MKSSLCVALSSLLVLAGCSDSVSDGNGGNGGQASTVTSTGDVNPLTSSSSVGSGSTSSGSSSTGGGACDDVAFPTQDLGTGADPANGDFGLDEALAELPEGPGPLRAIIDTELGSVTCELFPEVAPIGVANFVGLARGRRPAKDPLTHHWMVGKPFYDGLTFHRVIDDFVAQGGDPAGNGTGGPGYQFVNEIGDKTHDPGTLAYANAGADTNGSQFYIVAEVAQPQLDGGYTIFGLCDPVSVVQAITEVPTNANDKPVTPVHMTTVRITRCAP